ncbi:hypothetical protein DYB36_002646 [Aphanomyces astaci]|uniref:Uncharacterized protein n=1 Tax=Aphanomyces astaci TaxID=112090 RepID=A0A397AWV0_APHAT|nr:hypothetical protein DYB36_002646 [Aphanomyces astaci]
MSGALPTIGHSRSWAATQNPSEADNDTDSKADEAWENDFNFDVLPETSAPPPRRDGPMDVATRVKGERLALNFRLVDIVGRAYEAINELADEEIKLKEVFSQFKGQHSVNVDDDNDNIAAWMDQVLQVLADCCCVHAVGPHAQPLNIIDRLDEASRLVVQATNELTTTHQIPRHMVMIVQLWLHVETYALSLDKDYPAMASAIANAVLQMKRMDRDSHNNPHFGLTVVALNEMHEAASRSCVGISPKKQVSHLPKYRSETSFGPPSTKATHQVETVLVLRLALLSVVLTSYKHDNLHRRLCWRVVSSLTLCSAHILLESFDIPLAMDYACLASKLSAYLTLDDSMLSAAKAMQCQAQTSLQSLQHDKDWADFDEHCEHSQRMFSVDWTGPLTPKDCLVTEIGSPTSQGDPVGHDGDSENSSDWDVDEVKMPHQCSGMLQQPTGSASSLASVLNLRDLFVPMKARAPTSSSPAMLTQSMEHPAPDTTAPLPPPSSPYSRTFAAFETGNLLSNSFQSTRSMDQWLRDLPSDNSTARRRPHESPHPDDAAAAVHHLTTTPKFTQEWVDMYESSCRHFVVSAPDVCFQLAHTFFSDVAAYLVHPTGDKTVTSSTSAVLDAGLRLCTLVGEFLPPQSVHTYLSLLQSCVAGVFVHLRCTLVDLELRVHHALVIYEDALDSSDVWKTSLWGDLRDASSRLHSTKLETLTISQNDNNEDAPMCEVLELSMHVLLIAHCLNCGISPLTMKRISKACPILTSAVDGFDDDNHLDRLVAVLDIVRHFANHPLAASAEGTWHRLKLVYPLLPLTSPVRVRAGVAMGMTMLVQDDVHAAESIAYESIYVLHTHFTLHSMTGITALTLFGDALLAVQKIEFATAAFESACHIAHLVGATWSVVDLERKLAVLCSDHGDIDRSLRYYKRIRSRSLAKRMWFEYAYISVTMACLVMDRGEYAAAALDIHPILQQMQLLAPYEADVVTECQVLAIRLSICHLKLHCPHRAISTLELCLQHFKPKGAKHVVVLMWLAKGYYKSSQFGHCDVTLKTIAKLRKDHKTNHYTSVQLGGSFAKLPPPLQYSITLERTPPHDTSSDLYPLYTKVALKRNDFDLAAHYSALSIVYLELQPPPVAATTFLELAYAYYLRGKVLQAAAAAPWRFPMKLQSLDCEHLVPTKATNRGLYRRKSSALGRERVLVSLDECMYHSLRAFHHSYELFHGQTDTVGMMKAASGLSAVYLHKVFLPHMILQRPLDQLMKFSLARRPSSASASSHDIKTSSCVEFEFALADIETPTKFVWDSSVAATDPRFYIDACLNMSQLHGLRGLGPDALGFWYEARDVFLSCVLCPSGASMQRSLSRLVETLLTFDKSVVNENVVLLELVVTPWTSWRHATCLKKTGRRKCAMIAETSTSYQAKVLREKQPKGPSHQRHKSDTLELCTTRHTNGPTMGINVGGSARSLSTPPPPGRAPDMPRTATPSLKTHHRDMQRNGKVPQDALKTDAKCRRFLHQIWDHMSVFRGGCSLSLWLSSVGYDKDTMSTVVYVLEVAPASIVASVGLATGICDWKFIQQNQVTLVSAIPTTSSVPHPPILRRFRINETKALSSPLSASVVPLLFTRSSSSVTTKHKQPHRDVFHMFGREFTSRLPLIHSGLDGTLEATDCPLHDQDRHILGGAVVHYSLVCSPSLQSLPWECMPGVAMVRRPSAFLTDTPQPATSLPSDHPITFRICRVKSPRHVHSTTIETLSSWWTVLGYPSEVTLSQKKVKFSNQIKVVPKVQSSQRDDLHHATGGTEVEIVLASFIELNANPLLCRPTSTRLYIFAPPTYLPLLAKAMLKSLPLVKKPSMFSPRRNVPAVAAAGVLQSIQAVVSAFQDLHGVPVALYSVNP